MVLSRTDGNNLLLMCTFAQLMGCGRCGERWAGVERVWLALNVESDYFGPLYRPLSILLLGNLDASPQLVDFLPGPIPPHGVIVAQIEYVRTPSCLKFGEAFAVAGELVGVGSHGARVAGGLGRGRW